MGRLRFGYFVDEDKYYCWFCNEVKLIDEFVKDITKSLGFKTKCKKCNNEYHKNWRGNNENYVKYIENKVDRSYYKEYYEKNKDRLLGLQKKWRDKNREKIKEYNKKKYKENREDRIKQSEEYNLKNKDKLKGYRKKYYEENKEKFKEYYQLNKNSKNND
jgi:hypothetical protein